MASVESVTITCTLPRRGCKPNSRVHWRESHRDKKAARQQAMIEARAALGRSAAPMWKTAEVRITWYSRFAHHHPDPDNLLASCKGFFDGLQDAGVVSNDRGLIHFPPVLKTDKERPRVEITVRPAEVAA